jgi:hypothetical protein
VMSISIRSGQQKELKSSQRIKKNDSIVSVR